MKSIDLGVQNLKSINNTHICTHTHTHTHTHTEFQKFMSYLHINILLTFDSPDHFDLKLQRLT